MKAVRKLIKPNLYLYSLLSNIPYLNYEGKIMFIAFLGTHVPLISLLAYFVFSTSYTFEVKVQVLIIALVATLLGTAATLYAIHNLLAPITLTFLAQRQYLKSRKLPNLPTKFTDEAGILMADTYHTLTKLDEILENLTNYDKLTGLPNWLLFRDRLQQTLAQNQSDRQILAVIFLSIDRLDIINNAFGHSVGEAIIKVAAERLESCIKNADILARISEDKFAIMQTNIASINDAIGLSKQMINTLSQAVFSNDTEIHISSSLGISICSRDYNNIEQLLENARTAMYQAKQQGSNKYQFYSTELNTNLQERLQLENNLRKALERGEMLLQYQPKVSLRDGSIIGVEALLRWQSPTHGFISPAKFIPIAEQTGLIIPIGEWVLRTACAQNRQWQIIGLPPIKMAVNLSSRQFQEDKLVDNITQILQETNLKAEYLELELTESSIIENVQQAISTMNQLHELGISISLDDFGTGYSSLNYLKSFPIDTLKIDRAFVNELHTNSEDAAIIKAIISLAYSLQLSVIAEGVETQAQLNYLKESKCDEVQGYYISRPISAEALTALLRQEKNSNNDIKNLILAD